MNGQRRPEAAPALIEQKDSESGGGTYVLGYGRFVRVGMLS